MCGLVGFLITDSKCPLAEVNRYQKYFSKALYIDTLRGADSTGVARIDNDWVAATYKKAMPGYDFLEHGIAQEFMTGGATYLSSMLGHNRAATAGAVNAVNAHPFTHGDVTLMHNGTLDTDYGVGNKFAVDSENICYTLSKCTDDASRKTLLEALEGAFALVWYDEGTRTVNFARNEKRPLHFQETDHGWLYASEAWMIEGASSEQFSLPLKKKGSIKALPTGDWTSISLDTGEIRTVPFVPDDGYSRQSWGNYTASASSSSGNVAVKDEIKGLVKGDNVLVEYTSHGISSVNNEKLVTFYGKVVSQYPDAELPSTSVTMSGFKEEDLDVVLKDGNRVFVCEYGGAYRSSSPNHKSQVWVSSSDPLYTLADVKDFQVVEGDDAIFDKLIEVSGTEVEDKDIPFDGEVWCDHKGNEITREAMLNHANTPCGWCNSWIDIDKDEFLWNGDYLMHTECSGHYDESYQEQ